MKQPARQVKSIAFPFLSSITVYAQKGEKIPGVKVDYTESRGEPSPISFMSKLNRKPKRLHRELHQGITLNASS